jgi:ribosome maturation factor RimP
VAEQVSITQRVDESIAAILSQDGYELVCVELVGGGTILRLYIDHDSGITVDDCAKVSHRVSDLLDAEGLLEGAEGIGGQYTLEVSSPGLDRPLVRPAHFQKFIGRSVNVVANAAISDTGRKRVRGKLATADEQSICIEADGESFVIAYQRIERARLVPEF